MSEIQTVGQGFSLAYYKNATLKGCPTLSEQKTRGIL